MTVPEILSIISPLVSVAASFIFNWQLVHWRLKKLEEKLDKHNNVIERMQVIEGKVEVIQDELYQKRYK